MSCQCLLCLKNCRIIAQSLEHVYDNEHETRKGREFDILPIFGMCSVFYFLCVRLIDWLVSMIYRV